MLLIYYDIKYTISQKSFLLWLSNTLCALVVLSYLNVFMSSLYLLLLSSLSAAPPLPKSRQSWLVLWLDVLFGLCCIQTSREGHHCCAPSTAHVAAALKRPTWGDTHPLVIKISTARLCSTFLSLFLTLRCHCSRPWWWSRVEDRSSLSVGECDLLGEHSRSHQALAGTEIHLSDTALPYLSSEAKETENVAWDHKGTHNQL